MSNSLFNRLNFIQTAAFILSCCFVCSCENSQQEIDVWTKDKQLREEAIKVESYMSQDGKMRARLKAPLMYRILALDTQYVEFPNTMHVDFFDDSAKIESKLDCKYGKYFESLNKVYLRDSVVVISVKGDTLRCHDMWWDQTKGMFYTDSIATYISPGNNITGGRGMEATQDFKTVTFKKPLGTVKINDAGFAE
jgi:LPS export ABC transporter protein LptC